MPQCDADIPGKGARVVGIFILKNGKKGMLFNESTINGKNPKRIFQGCCTAFLLPFFILLPL